MKQRILLLYPPHTNLPFFGVYEPLVLEIFSAIAKEEGCEVELLDLRFDKHGCQRLHQQGYCPDLLGISIHGFPEIVTVNNLLPQLRKLWPKTTLITGGMPATLRPDLLDQSLIDIIVRGPGEGLWREYCRNGVSRTERCQIVQDENISKTLTFPLPDRGITARYRRHYLTHMPHYSGRGAIGPTGFTMMSQGCPMRCSFCVIPPGMLGLYRKRSIPDIIAELKAIEEPYIYFGDDNTFFDRKWSDELADAIREAGIKKEFATSCRADHICDYPELFRKWHDVGLRYLVVGVEAVSKERLVRLNKKTNPEINHRALAILKEIGIFAHPHILVTPDMQKQDFADIYHFVAENGCEYPVIVPFTPMPSTKDFEHYKAKGDILTEDLRYFTFEYNVLRPEHMTPMEYDREYDKLMRKIWSVGRFLANECGKMPFSALILRALFILRYQLNLMWKRRALYRNFKNQANATKGKLLSDSVEAPKQPSLS